MTKKLFNIMLLLVLCVFLYSQNEYSRFILGNSQIQSTNNNLIPVSNLLIENGKYFINVSNGYQVKRIEVELLSEIENGHVNIDYKLSENERFIAK